jgi:threonyl-tRNA synthetase
MPKIKLSDGKLIDFKTNVNGVQVSEKISKSLYKQAMVMSVDGKLKDLTSEISKDSEVKSFNLPSTLMTIACLNKDLLIFSDT